MMLPMDAHRAGTDELADLATTLAGAFRDDPVWSWVFVDRGTRERHLAEVWMLLLEGAVDYRWVWSTHGAGAVTVWIPPGLPELPEPHAARIGPLFQELLGDDVTRAEAIEAQFALARPTAPDHYYLSLFGTHPDHRGHGTGMALLADNLALVDAEHRPAYLESTNPANLARYRSVGFVERDRFALAGGGPVVTTMWRDAR